MEKRVKAASQALPPKPSKAVSKLDAKPTTTAKSALVKPKLATKTRRIELWSYDEYNQGTIVFSSTELTKVVARAKQYVTEINVDNALTSGEKDKHWAAYFVEIFHGKKPAEDVFYTGNKKDGRHYVYVLDGNDWKLQLLSKDAKVKFYLGEVDSGRLKEPWYLSDHKDNEIESLSAQELERKNVVFLKVV